MNKDFFSFAGTFLLLIGLAVGGMYALSRSQTKAESAVVNRLVAAHTEDKFGGSTPRETLDLLITALKQGDTVLASRYFIIESQDKVRGDLAVGKSNGVLPILISDLELVDNGALIFEGYYRFTATIDSGIELTYDLVFDDIAGIWKLESL